MYSKQAARKGSAGFLFILGPVFAKGKEVPFPVKKIGSFDPGFIYN